MVALNEGVRRKNALWRPAGGSQLESLVLAPWASRRRQDRLDLLDQLTPKIQELTRALEEIVEKRTVARRLRTHPGVRTIEVDFGFGTAAAAVLNSSFGRDSGGTRPAVQ